MAKHTKQKLQKNSNSTCDADSVGSFPSNRVATLTVLIAVIAIAIGLAWKPFIYEKLFGAYLHANEVRETVSSAKIIPSKPLQARKSRKLSYLGEYEDMFDHSHEVTKWDIYRPPDGSLKNIFALYEKKEYILAKREFQYALNSNPNMFWPSYGAAISADGAAELGQSNQLLEESILLYESFCNLRIETAKMSSVEREAELAACRRLADRFSFRGWSKRAIDVLADLTERYPNEKVIHHDVGIQLLLTGQHAKAKRLFEMLVNSDPTDGFAQVHLGFILKTIESDHETAIPHLIKGILSEAPGVRDGRFYYHLGDALVRTGKASEANKWYEEAYRKGLFLSPDQRSLYSVANLKAKPWWSLAETGHKNELDIITAHWQDIRKEGLSNLDEKTGLFKPEDEKLRDYGDWKQFTLFQRGVKVQANCNRAPVTCKLIEQHFPDAANCRRGQVKFSVMKPKTHVWPHTGPTNCRLRAHLGLKVPDGVYITVSKQTKQWEEGKMIVLDDSFEHEVWHNGTEDRMILIVDFWHPQINSEQKQLLKPI